MRTKTYVCFDGDEDMQYYLTLKMWDKNKKIDFNFNNAHDLTRIYSYNENNIKRHLIERMNKTKLLIVLIGSKTKNLYKYVRWEIELALKMNIPIIAVNLNKHNGMDEDRYPPILRDKPIVHIPFKRDALLHAIDNWPQYYSTAVANGDQNLFYRMS
jgi:hypothetical protein